MTKREQIVHMASQCCSYREIAEAVGVTRQYVYQIVRRCGLELCDFRKLSEHECVYPGLRNWWNQNRMTYLKFFDVTGLRYHDTNIRRLERYFSGESHPRKDYIDKLIAVTGLTYEQLFYEGGD